MRAALLVQQQCLSTAAALCIRPVCVSCSRKSAPAHQLGQLREFGYHILSVAGPVRARVACQEEVPQVVVCCQAAKADESSFWYKVYGEVQPLQ